MIPCEAAFFFLKCCKWFITDTEQCNQNDEEFLTAWNQPSYSIFNNRDLYPLKSSIWGFKWHSLTLCHWSCPNTSCCSGQWNGVLGEAMCYSRINSRLLWAMPSLTSGSAGRAAVSAPAGSLTASPGLVLYLWKDIGHCLIVLVGHLLWVWKVLGMSGYFTLLFQRLE